MKSKKLDAHEVGLTATILSDNYMKRLYATSLGQNYGYMGCVDEITQWAETFVRKFAHVVHWEDFIYSKENPYYGKTACWDDIVIAFGADQLKVYENI